MIVAVDANPAKPCLLQLLDANGQPIKSWTSDSALYYSQPKFLEDNKRVIVAARQTNGKMGWMTWDTETNEHDWLVRPINQMLGFPVVQGDTIFFTRQQQANRMAYMPSI
jgi:hypothetical protein